MLPRKHTLTGEFELDDWIEGGRGGEAFPISGQPRVCPRRVADRSRPLLQDVRYFSPVPEGSGRTEAGRDADAWDRAAGAEGAGGRRRRQTSATQGRRFATVRRTPGSPSVSISLSVCLSLSLSLSLTLAHSLSLSLSHTHLAPLAAEAADAAAGGHYTRRHRRQSIEPPSSRTMSWPIDRANPSATRAGRASRHARWAR